MQANDAAIKLRQNSQLVERGAALPNMLKSKFLRPELTLFMKGNTMKKLTVTNVNAVDTKHPDTLLDKNQPIRGKISHGPHRCFTKPCHAAARNGFIGR